MKDKNGKLIRIGNIVRTWMSAPWDEEQPIEREFLVVKQGRKLFCEGTVSNDEDDFLENFKHLEIVKSK